MRFQSTRPLRGGTYPESRADTHIKISIHPSLAGRDDDDRPRQMVRLISIRPPLAGRDPKRSVIVIVFVISIHPPLAGRDRRGDHDRQAKEISIHPPLAGRDPVALSSASKPRHFNPPAPCGAGPAARTASDTAAAFQSTRPLRGGTAILHKKTVQNIAYCTKSAFTLAVLSGFLALMRPFFLPNVHKFRCEPSEESLLAPRSHAYTIRTPSG